MGSDSTQSDLSSGHKWLNDGAGARGVSALGLSLVWSLSDPGRVGEVVVVPDGASASLGRGPEQARFGAYRPGGSRPGPPLTGRMLSRHQLVATSKGKHLEVRNVGSCALRVDGQDVDRATVQVGDILELDRQLLLMVVRRDPLPEPLMDLPLGAPDAHGLVGESMAMWTLRSRIAFLARRSEAVLIRGSSGTGKELVARALHAASERASGPWVARNAATLPETLIDAELFGNLRNYPNAGMPERPGLVGAAHGGTLFLDEIGELPETHQAHLLRVLDRGGTYQRLGEARERRSDFRFVAATNRDPSRLKHDFAARMTLSLAIPGLDERREDIPLLAQHLLAAAAGSDPELAERFFEGPHARITPSLALGLLRHRYTTHVRELERILWTAMTTSTGRALSLTPEVKAMLEVGRESVASNESSTLSREDVQAALDAAGGSVTKAAKALGLSSRFVLYRQMKRLGIDK